MLLATCLLAASPVQDVHCTEEVIQAPVQTEFFTGIWPWRPALLGSLSVIPTLESGELELLAYEQDPTGSEWSLRQTLAGQGGGSEYGRDFRLTEESNGDRTLIVGEPKWRTPNNIQRGRVHVYSWDASGAEWDLQQVIPSPVAGHERFGQAIARWGDWLAVTSAAPSLAVRLFQRDSLSGEWLLHSTLPGAGGDSLDMQGDRLLTGSGLGFTLYRRNVNDEWLEEATVTTNLSQLQLLDDEILGTNFYQPSLAFPHLTRIRVLRPDPITGEWEFAQDLHETDFPGSPCRSRSGPSRGTRPARRPSSPGRRSTPRPEGRRLPAARTCTAAIRRPATGCPRRRWSPRCWKSTATSVRASASMAHARS